jgi:hypothetical protein
VIELLNIPQNQINLASSIATRKTLEKLIEIAQSPAATEVKTDNVEAKKADA